MNLDVVIQGIAFVVWIVFAAIIVVSVMRVSRGKPFKSAIPLIIGIGILAILLSLVGAGLVFIEPDQRGVVMSAFAEKGYREQALQPGLRWVIPVVENVRKYSISRQTYTMSVAPQEGQVAGDDSIRARTKDGQEVYIDASVIYSIDPANVIQLHITWQDRYEDGVVRSLSRGIIRDAASQYGVEEIVSSKRADLEQFITDKLTIKLAENDLLLSDFILRDIHFSDEYAAAVEQKQIAEQQALQAEFVVQSKKQEAEQARQTAQGQADAAVIAAKGAAEARVIQAKAEAEALSLIAAILDEYPNLLTYQYITKLAPNVQVIFLPSDSPFILPLNNLTPLPQPE